MAHIDDAFRVDTLSLSDSVLITQGVLDPSTGAGFEAPEGSVYLRSFGTDSTAYIKVGAGDLDWSPVYSGTTVGISLNNASTGILIGGALSRNTDPTKFDIAAGVGIVVNNYSDPLNPTAQLVTWPALLGNSLTYLLTASRTSVGITPTGLVIQAPNSFTNTHYRDNIIIGDIDHANHVQITGWRSDPSAAFDAAVRLHDLADAIGPINVSGNVFVPNGTNMKMNKSAGQTYVYGGNFQTLRSDPDVATDIALSPVQFMYSWRNTPSSWTAGSPVTDINPNLWDNGSGTLQTVPNGKFTIQRVIYFGGVAQTRVQYGQALYSNLAAAEAAIIDPVYVINPEFYDGVIRAYVIIQSSATDLSDTTKVIISEGMKFGAGSGGTVRSATTLQQAYLNSVSPEITTIPELGAFTIIQGVGVTGNLLEGMNSSNVLTFSIDPSGNVTTLGNVDGRDVSVDGTNLDNHIANHNNPHLTSILNLGGVSLSSPISGQVLTFDGTNWANQNASSVDKLVRISATDTTSDYLQPKLVSGSNVTITKNNSGGNETLTISSPVIALTRHNGAVTQTFSGATTMLFDTEIITAGIYSYNSGVVTISENGNYLVSSDISLSSSAASLTVAQIGIYKNGVIEPGSLMFASLTAAAGRTTSSCETVVQCVAGTTIQVIASRLSGTGNLTSRVNGCRLNIKKLG